MATKTFVRVATADASVETRTPKGFRMKLSSLKIVPLMPVSQATVLQFKISSPRTSFETWVPSQSHDDGGATLIAVPEIVGSDRLVLNGGNDTYLVRNVGSFVDGNHDYVHLVVEEVMAND